MLLQVLILTGLICLTQGEKLFCDPFFDENEKLIFRIII